MKTGHFTKLLVCVLGVAGAIALAISGSAQAKINENIDLINGRVGIAISPAKAQIDIIPGQVTTNEMRIRGTGHETNLVFAELTPYSVVNQDYEQNFAEMTPRNEIVRWTTLELSECDVVSMPDSSNARIYFNLRPQEECYLKYSIDTPSNAPGGSQHAAIFVQSYTGDKNAEDGDAGIISSHRIGMTIFASNRQGVDDARGKIIKQRIPFWVFSGPLRTSAVIENPGNLDFNAEIEIETKNLFGNTVFKSEQPVSSIIMAETTRNLPSNWNQATIGIFKTTQTVRFLDEEHVITKWSFLIPLWLLLAIVCAIAIAVLAVIYGRRKKANRKSKRRRS